MIATFPRSLDGLGMPLTLCLVALDVVLGALTGWLAFARSASLDERQAALRDRAYRVAFRLVLVGVLLMIVALFMGSIADSYNGIQFSTAATTGAWRPLDRRLAGGSDRATNRRHCLVATRAG